jgi:hypothetical protein
MDPDPLPCFDRRRGGLDHGFLLGELLSIIARHESTI